MMMITCRHVYESASDYVEGPVNLRERLLLFVHLVICKHCRRYIRQLKAVIGIAAVIPPMQEPTEAEIDILARRLARSDPNT